MDDLINRLQARKVFNGNTTIRRDGPGCPWVEERQTVTDPLCAEAAAALTEAQATIARLDAEVARLMAYGPPEFYVNATHMHERAAARAKDETAAWRSKAQDANRRALSDDATIRGLQKKLAALSPGKGE